MQKNLHALQKFQQGVQIFLGCFELEIRQTRNNHCLIPRMASTMARTSEAHVSFRAYSSAS